MTLQVLDNPEIWIPTDIAEPKIEKSRVYSTRLGVLYEGDCLQLLPYFRRETIDTVFADPPFNLSKEYGAQVNDDRPDENYISWCKEWLDHCIRVLKPGGALFLYNLPKCEWGQA